MTHISYIFLFLQLEGHYCHRFIQWMPHFKWLLLTSDIELLSKIWFFAREIVPLYQNQEAYEIQNKERNQAFAANLRQVQGCSRTQPDHRE